MAVVDQDIILFEDTIANNIKMWDNTIEDFEMILAARDAQLHEDIMRRDGGYQYRITEGGKDFSGGQRQRMELARVLAGDPTIIIMDEATSALDAKTEYEVVNAIKDRGITCIIVAHRLSTIKNADRIAVINEGEEKKVTIELDERAFAYYNVNIGDWHVESGEFKILVGASSRDIKLETSINVESTVDAVVPDYKATAPCYYGADIMNVSADAFKAVYGKELPPSERDKNAPFTVLNTIEDSQDSKWGGRIYRLLIKLLGADTMAGSVATQLPIKNFISMSFGLFSPEMAEGLIMIIHEDKLGKGLKIILKGIPHILKNLDRLKKI